MKTCSLNTRGSSSLSVALLLYCSVLNELFLAVPTVSIESLQMNVRFLYAKLDQSVAIIVFNHHEKLEGKVDLPKAC
jgi:hypothetical protein